MGDQFDDKEELTEAAEENEQENDKDEGRKLSFSLPQTGESVQGNDRAPQ